MNLISVPWTIKPGENYGGQIDTVIAYASARGFTPEDFLRLAWAALDQGSAHTTARERCRAFETIGNLFPLENDQ